MCAVPKQGPLETSGVGRRVGWRGAGAAPEREVFVPASCRLVPAPLRRAPSPGRRGRRGPVPAVLPPSARAGRPLGASGPRARGSGGRTGTPGLRLPRGGPRTSATGRRSAESRTARPASEAGPRALWGRDDGRARGSPQAALVGSAVWRVERAGVGGWRWERAVGVDCSAPEPRCLWLPHLSHSDRRTPGLRPVRVSNSFGSGEKAGRQRLWAIDRVTLFLADSVRHSQTDILAVEKCLRRIESQGQVAPYLWELYQGC